MLLIYLPLVSFQVDFTAEQKESCRHCPFYSPLDFELPLTNLKLAPSTVSGLVVSVPPLQTFALTTMRHLPSVGFRRI